MSGTPEQGTKHVYACEKCGYSFYTDSVGTVDPSATAPCPQCGAEDAHFTFTLGNRCSSADC